jgi:hypothetical protein
MIRLSAFSSPMHGGLGAHYDCTANMIIQLSGRKRVRVAPSGVRNPTRQFAAGAPSSPDTALEFAAGVSPEFPRETATHVLRPGSVIYLPPGWWHETHALGETFSISLINSSPTFVEVFVSALRSRLVQSERWRERAYGAWGDARIREHSQKAFKTLIDELPATLQKLTPDDLLGTFDQLDLATRLSYLTPRSRFRRNPDAKVAISRAPADARVRVTFGRQEFQAPLRRSDVPAFAWVAKRRGVFSVEEMSDAVGTSFAATREAIELLASAKVIQTVAQALPRA